MKKLLAIILVMAICLCFTACGGAGKGNDASEAQAGDTTPAAPETDNAETDSAETDNAETDNADTEAPAEEPESAADVTGEYYAFAMERDGYCVASPNFGEDKDGMITLNEDGTGTWLTGDIVNNLKWTQEGDTLKFTDESGLVEFPATIKLLSDGIFTMVYEGVDGTSYFAKLNADTSAIETMTPDEYKAAVGQ